MHNTIHFKLNNEINLQQLQFYFTVAPVSVAIAIILAGYLDNKLGQ